MILKIVPECTTQEVMSCEANVKLLDYNSFNLVEFHPFIRGNKWEKFVVVLRHGIRYGYLKQVIGYLGACELIIPEDQEIDVEITSRIMELYPEYSKDIRHLMLSKGDVRAFLKERGVLHE